jgi:hypothetical protein
MRVLRLNGNATFRLEILGRYTEPAREREGCCVVLVQISQKYRYREHKTHSKL